MSSSKDISMDILVLHQPQVTQPTAKLMDINNDEKAPLAFQCAAVAAVTACLKAHVAPTLPLSSPSDSELAPSTLTQQVAFNTNEDGTDQESDLPIPGGSKHQIVVSSDDESSVDGSKQKKKQKSKGM